MRVRKLGQISVARRHFGFDSVRLLRPRAQSSRTSDTVVPESAAKPFVSGGLFSLNFAKNRHIRRGMRPWGSGSVSEMRTIKPRLRRSPFAEALSCFQALSSLTPQRGCLYRQLLQRGVGDPLSRGETESRSPRR